MDHVRGFVAFGFSYVSVELAMEAFAGGPVVRIALQNGTLTVGPTWRTSAGHTPTPQVYENLTCTLSPSALAEHSVIEVFLDSSVLEVFSDTGHCAIATRVLPPPRGRWWGRRRYEQGCHSAWRVGGDAGRIWHERSVH